MKMLDVLKEEHLDEVVWEITYESGRSCSEYVDTYRCTPLSDVYPTEEDVLHHDNKRSCCGYNDWIFKTNDGTLYLVGYNYGH
jgi:hypothetical protein